VGTQRQPLTRLNTVTGLRQPLEVHENKQQFRLLVALTLLLISLVVVIVKDRDFWFGLNQAQEARQVSPAPAASASKNQSVAVTNIATQPALSKAAHPAKTSRGLAPATALKPEGSDSPAVATNRVVLPPLDVEVVAGDTHRIVHPGSNAAKVEIPGNANRLVVDLPKSASENSRLAAASLPELQQTVAAYPVLGQHSRVQGSVVLQAVIGADGNIENLHVLSGPAILVTAAQQAVREWRFKPYLQNGQPVETKARITVNFSIKVSDSTNAS